MFAGLLSQKYTRSLKLIDSNYARLRHEERRKFWKTFAFLQVPKTRKFFRIIWNFIIWRRVFYWELNHSRFHTPLHPGPEWRIIRMSPLCRIIQWRHDSRLLLLLNWFLHIIKRTLHLEDMNFMFSWQEQYRSCHSNIKFLSSRHRVISSI